MWSIIFQFYLNTNEKITICNFLICSLRSIKLLTSILLIWIISKIKQLNILKRKKKKNCLGSRFKLSIYHQYFTNRSASIHRSRQKIRQRTQLSFTEVSERTRLLRRVFAQLKYRMYQLFTVDSRFQYFCQDPTHHYLEHLMTHWSREILAFCYPAPAVLKLEGSFLHLKRMFGTPQK